MRAQQNNFPYAKVMTLYDAAWRLAVPLLRFSPRLKNSLRKRSVPPPYGGVEWGGGCTERTVWMHAASAGEAYLAWELLKAFPVRGDRPVSFVLTTCTDQGLELLEKCRTWAAAERPDLALTAEYFPFDTPSQMERALEHVRPEAVVLLETELWPGLMHACARRAVPLVVVNGRMRSSSLGRYLALRKFFQAVAPREILAISEADAMRFGLLFGAQRVRTMSNIKFDRVTAPESPAKASSLAQIFGPRTPFAVLGSVREEEEPEAALALQMICRRRPKTCVGVFPRHMHRIAAWCERLRSLELEWTLRSEISESVAPGTVILWDKFGELNQAYGLAKAAFVGGSLRPLGGQNFLEPLALGVATCVGPYWGNFAWVGRELVDSGLLKEVDSAESLAGQMVKFLNRPPKPASLRKRFAAYLAPRKGGAALAGELVARYLG